MALQTSGAISLNDIHVEAGGSSGSEVSLNDTDVRGLIGKSAGTQMSFSEWYGAFKTTTLRFIVKGAKGGNSVLGAGDNIGGDGGVVDVTYAVPAGSSFAVTVYCATAGGSSGNVRGAGAGGGASSVAYGATLLAVGGGGGGNSGYNQATSSGNGGGTTGVAGSDASANGYGYGGGGGTQSAAGAAGAGSRGSGLAGSGSNGGSGWPYNWTSGGSGYGTGGLGGYDGNDVGCGGGGGGYYGGGGGGMSGWGACGGGGSGYMRTASLPTNWSYSSGSNSQGGNAGNGVVEIYVGGSLVKSFSTGNNQSYTINT